MPVVRRVTAPSEYDKFIKKAENLGKTYYFCILKEVRRTFIALPRSEDPWNVRTTRDNSNRLPGKMQERQAAGRHLKKRKRGVVIV